MQLRPKSMKIEPNCQNLRRFQKGWKIVLSDKNLINIFFEKEQIKSLQEKFFAALFKVIFLILYEMQDICLE